MLLSGQHSRRERGHPYYDNTDFLERNARLYRDETALVEINPSEERDRGRHMARVQSH